MDLCQLQKVDMQNVQLLRGNCILMCLAYEILISFEISHTCGMLLTLGTSVMEDWLTMYSLSRQKWHIQDSRKIFMKKFVDSH